MSVTSFGGLFGVPKCHETARNKEKQREEDKDFEEEETENTRKTATILWRVFLAIFHYKIVSLLMLKLVWGFPNLEVPNHAQRIFQGGFFILQGNF